MVVVVVVDDVVLVVVDVAVVAVVVVLVLAVDDVVLVVVDVAVSKEDKSVLSVKDVFKGIVKVLCSTKFVNFTIVSVYAPNPQIFFLLQSIWNVNGQLIPKNGFLTLDQHSKLAFLVEID